jgi:hypothetical protein
MPESMIIKSLDPGIRQDDDSPGHFPRNPGNSTINVINIDSFLLSNKNMLQNMKSS